MILDGLDTGGLARSCQKKSSNIKFENFGSILLQRKFYEELMPHIKFTAIKETLKNISSLWAIEDWAFLLVLFPPSSSEVFLHNISSYGIR